MRYFLLLLGVILVIDLLLVGQQLASDPPVGFSQDRSFNTDGYWYLADARSAVDGTESTVVGSYHRPGITWPAAALYRLGGVNHASSRALNVLASLLTVGLLAFWMRRHFGSAVAIAGALILVLDPGFLACSRSAVVYPWVAFWTLAVAVIGFGGGWGRWLIGVSLMAIAAYAVKSMVAIVAPAFAIDAVLRLRRSGVLTTRATWIGASIVSLGVLGGLGPWTIPTFWKRIGVYTFGGGFHPIDQLLEYEARSRVFSTSPVTIALAFAGLVWFSRFISVTQEGATKQRATTRAVLITVWGLVALFAVSRYTPLRYHVPLLPLMVFAAGAPLSALLREAAVRHRRWTAPRWWDSTRAVMVGALAVYLLAMLLDAASRGALPGVWLGSGLGMIIVSAAIALTRRSWLPPRGETRLAPTVVTLVVAIGLVALTVQPRVARAVAGDGDSLQRSSRALASIVLPSAELAGPYAHVLTTGTGHTARQMNSLRFGQGELRKTIEALGSTHLVTYHLPTDEFLGVFERDGTPIELIDRFQVRGLSVYLYRFANHIAPRSDYEHAIRALANDDLDTAEKHLRATLAGFPDSASAWCKLGVVRQRHEDPETARKCFLEAVRHDPTKVEAHVSLANLYGSSGYVEEAYLHLEAATRAARDSDHLAEQYRQFCERLGLAPVVLDTPWP